jgi:BRCT domain type II-containing protein
MKNGHAVTPVMQTIIDARVEAIEEAHANNLIEGLDMGADALAAMLERARQPVSNEEFTRREEALWLKRHRVDKVVAA